MLITKAAIMYSDGVVLEGHSYGDIAYLASKLSMGGDRIEGFVTSSDEFVLPTEAAIIAVNSGQVKEVAEKLTPEDLWPTMNLE